MNFQELELRSDYLTDTNSFPYKNIAGKDFEIEVKKYLPIQDKIDLVQTALQKAEEDGIYNDIRLDVYFHLNIVYLYTNIEFSIEDREDEFKLYDMLENEDIIDKVISCMGEEEYDSLLEYLNSAKKDSLKYRNTAAAVLRSIVQDLPKNAAAAKEIVDSFNPEQYQEVINFATAANGGRNINTNMAPVEQQTAPISTAANEQSNPPKRKVLNIQSAVKKD